MKVLLVGINAKYIQTNLAVRLLRSYAERHSSAVRCGQATVEIAEFNINQNTEAIVRGIYETSCEAVFFSTYIWNRAMVFRTAEEIRSICPSLLIGLGGPEVSWAAEKALSECTSADLILRGEGEQTFCEILDALPYGRDFTGILGLSIRNTSLRTENRPVMENLDSIPFPYSIDMPDFDPENKIVYYESSRGCPFSCSYCLSSLDKTVRYYSLERVYADISFFLENAYPLVKFVDRTFNLDPERYLSIWKYIRDHHNNTTLFHFEIAAEYLSDEALVFLETMPEGSIQFEIGIQSTNPQTLKAVDRPAHPMVLADKIRRIPKKIHAHVDLIAGLPGESLEKLEDSFDFAFELQPDMLQLGFLKILAGTRMEETAKASPGYIWSRYPPYEVIASPDLQYVDLVQIKDIEQVLDNWYNSGLMRNCIHTLVTKSRNGKAFSVFKDLAAHIRAFYPDGDLYLPRKTADAFACMANFLETYYRESGGILEYLRYDFLLQGKPGCFPDWYERRYDKKKHDAALLFCGLTGPGLESRKNSYSRTEYDEFFNIFGTGRNAVLFVYNIKKGEEKKVRTILL